MPDGIFVCRTDDFAASSPFIHVYLELLNILILCLPGNPQKIDEWKDVNRGTQSEVGVAPADILIEGSRK